MDKVEPQRYYDFSYLLKEEFDLTKEEREEFLKSLTRDEIKDILANSAVNSFTIYADIMYAKSGKKRYITSDKVFDDCVKALKDIGGIKEIAEHIGRKMVDAKPCGLIYSQLLDFEAYAYKLKKARLTSKE